MEKIEIEAVKIFIDCSNDAFAINPGTEIARILRGLAVRFDDLNAECLSVDLRDLNGNYCGGVTILRVPEANESLDI